jgi:signal transduction histidine kinase
VESEPGQGSRFHVWLPEAEPAPAEVGVDARPG